MSGIMLFTCVSSVTCQSQVKNVILMNGNGMGVAQIHAGCMVNKGKLNLEKVKYKKFYLSFI